MSALTGRHALPPPVIPSSPGHGPETLARNLAVLAARCPIAAAAIARAEPRADLTFTTTDDGMLSAELAPGSPAARLLASRRRPIDEAQRWAASVEVRGLTALVAPGFGLGYHARALSERLGPGGLVVVFENDVPLLRSVLSRIDHAAWLASTRLVIVTREDDPAELTNALAGLDGFLAAGTRLVDHPVSRARLGPAAGAFESTFAQIIHSVRTNVVTTMVQMQTSMHNMAMNLAHYAGGEGVADLAGAAAGAPAIVVAAGPSLERNIAELTRPGLRDRAVIIATQTTLKPLLSRGIRPHFVTALDYHEVSKRFYEGLTPADVEGVTLIAEPQASPAILDTFPGRIRCPGDAVLDLISGQPAGAHGGLPKGATVAHLAYYLARHLGCDPVILVGQDLGFTHGQYYSAGAMIHSVWASELSGFRTLEMFEWERVKRMGAILRHASDARGRRIYTDEQMATYLVQFERDFLADKEEGRRTIDATEGGVAKAHTTPMPLARALDTHAAATNATVARLATPPAGASRRTAPDLKALTDRLTDARTQAMRLTRLTIETREFLDKMLACAGDQARIGRLLAQVDARREEATRLDPAYHLAQYLNQSGALRRFKADRAIDTADDSPLERQRRQIERDLNNMDALRSSAESLVGLLDEAREALQGGPKPMRPRALRESAAPAGAPAQDTANAQNHGGAIGAIILVDAEHSGMGTRRDLATPIAGKTALRWTLEALARTRGLSVALLASEDPAAAMRLAGLTPGPVHADGELAASIPGPHGAMSVRALRVDLAARRGQQRTRLGARLWSRHAWRGGIGQFSVYDEAFDAPLFADLMARAGLDATAVVGCDWALLDPSLAAACIARYREDPEHHRVTFVHAAPGLGVMVLSRAMVGELAGAGASVGVFATPAAMLGYVPVAPHVDPIARPNCVVAPAPARDAGRRFIADGPAACRAAADVLTALGPGPDAERTATRFARAERASPGVEHIIIELTTRRAARPVWEASVGPADIGPAALERAAEMVRERAALRPIAVTLAGRGDPLRHAGWADAVRALRDAGAAGIHVRTMLDRADDDAALIPLLRDGTIDVVSMDLLATTAPTYFAMTGSNGWAAVMERTHNLVRARPVAGGLPAAWIVPRFTKCDRSLPEMEPFYDYWLLHAGAAVIDPLPTGVSDAIAPLPIPTDAAERLTGLCLGIRADGSVVRTADDRLPSGASAGRSTMPHAAHATAGSVA